MQLQMDGLMEGLKLKYLITFILLSSLGFAQIQQQHLSVIARKNVAVGGAASDTIFNFIYNAGVTNDGGAEGNITNWVSTVGGYDFTTIDTSRSPNDVDTALYFDGTDDFLRLADGGYPFDSRDSSFTMEAWVWKIGTASNTVLMAKYISTVDSSSWLWRYTTAGQYYLFLSTALVLNDDNGAPYGVLNNNDGWDYVALTWDRAVGADMWHNGVLVETEHTSEWTDHETKDLNTTAYTTIGGRKLTGEAYWPGYIKQITGYHTAKDSAYFANKYAEGVP